MRYYLVFVASYVKVGESYISFPNLLFDKAMVAFYSYSFREVADTCQGIF